jgi:hypothetical protein
MASASFSICAYRISVSDIDLDAYATGFRLVSAVRELLKVDNAWIWDMAQENAFQQIKRELASSGTLSHYDLNKESIGNSAKSLLLSNGTKGLWSVSNLNLVPIK